MLFSPRDYVIAAADPGFTLVRMQKAAAGLTPSFVTDCATYEEATRKARLLALMEGVHAWASPSDRDEYTELVMAYHEHAPWAQPWHVLDRGTLAVEIQRGPGVYLIGDGRPRFIGESDDVYARLMFHLADLEPCMKVTPLLFSCKMTPTGPERRDLLARLLRWWKPPCNSNP
jgi:hypothetical protein